MRVALSFYVAALSICALTLIAAEGGSESGDSWMALKRFFPLEYFEGRWTIRDLTPSTLSMFQSPKVEVFLQKAGAFEGLLNGWWIIRGGKQKGVDGGSDDVAEGGEGIPGGVAGGDAPAPLTSITYLDEEISINPQEDLLLFIRLEVDATLVAGTFSVSTKPFAAVFRGEDDDDPDEDADAKGAATTGSASTDDAVSSVPFVFQQSVGQGHPFRLAFGSCPSIPLKCIQPDSARASAAPTAASFHTALEALKSALPGGSEENDGPAKEDGAEVSDHLLDQLQGTCNSNTLQRNLSWCSTYQAVVLDREGFSVTLTFPKAAKGGVDSTIPQLVSRSWFIKRINPGVEKATLWKLSGTIGMILLVAAVKFGPRLYFKKKGIDVDSYKGRRALHQKIANLSPEQRAALLKKHREEVLKGLSDADIAKLQEREQTEFVKSHKPGS
jgi:hypothetical protein